MVLLQPSPASSKQVAATGRLATDAVSRGRGWPTRFIDSSWSVPLKAEIVRLDSNGSGTKHSYLSRDDELWSAFARTRSERRVGGVAQEPARTSSVQ